ncbi:MAG TPA: segregation/condensation protein A [Candidatus Saccharimonadales bacterium]|nr:segregation/condensation protein A [Candidatus Saccharimonadales bacterium]
MDTSPNVAVSEESRVSVEQQTVRRPEGDPEPDPHPAPDTPDPEPDRDPHPGPPPAGPDPDPDVVPRIDPPTNPDETPVKVQGTREQENEGQAPPLVLTHPEPKAGPKPAGKEPAKAGAKPKSGAEEQQYSPFEVTVGKVYDGPLDLLLDLIRKQDIDIYDIPIARITAQFLAYVNQLKASDVDVAGEFIYTASLLIHIKSKMLLPREKIGPEDVAEDPRRELVERLLEHERFKNAAQMLQQKQILESATWTNPGIREFKHDAAAEPEIAADTTDLVRIFQQILERLRKRPVFNVQDDSVTVGQMIQFLGRRMTMEDKPVALRRLLAHTKSERALVAMFLALLELVRLQAILLRQDRAFSEIFIKKSGQFDAVVSDNLAVRDDWK